MPALEEIITTPTWLDDFTKLMGKGRERQGHDGLAPSLRYKCLPLLS
jgi:hypothetical protein